MGTTRAEVLYAMSILFSQFFALSTLAQQHRKNLTSSVSSSALNSMKMSVLYISRDLPPQPAAYMELDYGRSRDRDQAGLACWAPGTCVHQGPRLLLTSAPAIEDRNTCK